jgi:electron transfer flavoprotein alpha subunit
VSVAVVLERRSGSWSRMSFETLAAGQKIAQELSVPVYAAIAGGDASAAASELTSYAVDKVYSIEHQLLAQYTADGFTAAFEQFIKSASPEIVLFPHTYQVRDFAPKLAARFGKALISDVVSLRVDNGRPVFTRQLFQGKLNADVTAGNEGPVFASVQAGAFRGAEPSGGSAVIENFFVSLDAARIRSRPGDLFRESQRSVDLSNAELIVSVGRGIKEKENLPVVEELAQALGAELAASRPICDNGWLPMERQVGSSGQTVSPKAYFAIGISGAIQHLVGMKGAKTIVAINKDENAPIFEVADYGIVGDLFEVVPALVEEIKKAKS